MFIINQMKETIKIQGANGNWDYNEYMYGMFNGMECMLAIAENREPIYRERPKNFLQNKKGE